MKYIRRSILDPERLTIIAPSRGKRPKYFPEKPGNETVNKCPFCPGREYLTPPAVLVLNKNLEFKSEKNNERVKDWFVRIFPNKYPALTRDHGGVYGYHEVVVETPIHDERKYLSDPRQVYYALIALRKRIKDIFENDKRIKSIIVIKNSGPLSGGSIPHPHLQLLANDFIPPQLSRELRVFRKGCPLCGELESFERLVLKTRYFTTVTRYAPRQSYELIIIPHRHVSSIINTEDYELLDLAHHISRIILGLKTFFGWGLSYNFWIHIAPRNIGNYHWHIEVQPTIEIWGGYERGTDIYIVDALPEDAALRLRETIRKLT